MLSSRRNRGTLGIDDPWNDDGFYLRRRFHAKQKSGKSGKRLWRRGARRVENKKFQRDLTTGEHD